MAKRKQLPATAVAYVAGFVLQRAMPGQPEPQYGIKARVGQYVRPYTRSVELGAGRVSKGRRRRHEHDHGTTGLLDYSAKLNANR